MHDRANMDVRVRLCAPRDYAQIAEAGGFNRRILGRLSAGELRIIPVPPIERSLISRFRRACELMRWCGA